MSMSMNVHKELPSAQKMQLALIHLVHTSAAATMVIMEMASLVMVSNYFVLTLFYLLNLISDYFISYVFTGVSVSSSGFNYLSLINVVCNSRNISLWHFCGTTDNSNGSYLSQRMKQCLQCMNVTDEVIRNQIKYM